MRSSGVVAIPQVSRRTLRLFSGYVDWYLRRNFHCVRLAAASYGQIHPERPILIVANHPSWWDPLLGIELALHSFPDRLHYAPIEADALKRYGFFKKLGFFGVETGSAAGAATFLRMGEAILRQPASALWVTSQGQFVDARIRPVTLRPGTGHLIRRLADITVLPVAFEYPFWEERFAEALIRFGEPLEIDNGRSQTPDEWTNLIAASLQRAQDQLAGHSIARDRKAFEVITSGRAGIGVYDLWRTAMAAVRGRRFRRAHGAEHL